MWGTPRRGVKPRWGQPCFQSAVGPLNVRGFVRAFNTGIPKYVVARVGKSQDIGWLSHKRRALQRLKIVPGKVEQASMHIRRYCTLQPLTPMALCYFWKFFDGGLRR